MPIRTDLALEKSEIITTKVKGVISEEERYGDVKITRIRVVDNDGEKALDKPKGHYITIEGKSFASEPTDDNCRELITEELIKMLPKTGMVLVAGLGNVDITPDAFGPKTASKIFATRHINEEMAKQLGLNSLRNVSSVVPGVLGKTGIETAEIILGIVDHTKPSAVIAVDALASRRLSRLGTTVQISDTGISPGSGVGNKRCELSSNTLGVPVISIGVPTVVDAMTLAHDVLDGKDSENTESSAEKMMVTPREIDSVIQHASDIVALGINCALHPDLLPEELMALV